MPAKGHKHEARALGAGGSISRGTQYGMWKKKELEKRVCELEAALFAISPHDLTLLRESGSMPESVRPFAAVAAAEVLRLRRSAEGEPGTSQYRALSEGQATALRVAERHLLLGLCEQARALTAGDGDAAARAGGLLSKFLAVVKDAIGLGPRELEVPDLSTYLEQKAAKDRACDADGSAPAPAIEPEAEAASSGQGDSAASHPRGAALHPDSKPAAREGRASAGLEGGAPGGPLVPLPGAALTSPPSCDAEGG